MSALGPVTSRREVVPAVLSAIEEALAGRGPAGVLLRGELGAGKSHLVGEVVAELGARSRQVVAVPASISRPYAVMSALLDLPSPVPVPPRYDEVLLERIDELSSDGDLILTVDDLDLADAASLHVLERVVQSGAPAPVAVLGTIGASPPRDEVSRFITRSGAAILDVPPFDLLDLDALVHQHTGAWPEPAVRALLVPVAANPLHALAILDGLAASGALREGALLRSATAPGEPAPDVRDPVIDLVATLEGSDLDVARALAVFGAPATIEEIASVLAAPPLSLLGPVQRLLDKRVVVAADDAVTFANDLYRQAIYGAAPAPVRRLLHSTAGKHGAPAERARHLMASQARPDEVVGAVLAAALDLDNAPGVAAELVADALASTDVGEEAAAALTATRARALARSGRLREAWEAARSAQAHTRDPAVLTALRRVELFSLSTRGRVDDALELIATTLALPVPEPTRALLTHHRSYLSLLGARTPVPLEPLAAAPDDLPLNGLVAEALRRCLLGDTGVALEYAWLASRRYLAADHDPNEGLSADIWLPFIELFHNGPDAARLALHEVVQRRDERGDGWQTAGHQAIGGGIDALAGHIEDAVAQYDAAWESATRTELGWTSQIVGWRILLDVLRGDTPAAARRLAAWDISPGVVQLGIPQVERARMALLEAERRYAEAADTAQQMWSTAIELRLYAWAAMTAPEVARIALRAADDDLRRQVATDLALMPAPAGLPARSARELARAMCEGAYSALPRTAAMIADLAAESGDGLLRLTATEEAAVAAALSGDRDEARGLARDALTLAESFGAAGIAARVSGRMRSAGVRLGSTAPRARPSHGWESLTPTERTVVELIARGLSGPDIARHLHLSPRTVQTHVSHALAKLQVANRVQLAALAVARLAAEAD